MGYGTTRSLERVAAAMGELDAAPVRFEAAADITEGGVLLALPALLAIGLLRYTPNFYKLPKGYYGIDSIFLLLAMMALARLTSMEQLRYVAPGEWGDLLGLDRVPEVRCLRSKLALLSRQDGQAAKWNTELAKDWMGELPGGEMLFYIDGHVRVYHGSQTELPRHYVARQRLCLRATTDYWINAMDGQPFFYVNREADPGLLATMRQDLVPWLEANAPGPGGTSGTHGDGSTPTLVHPHPSTGKAIVQISFRRWRPSGSPFCRTTSSPVRTGRWRNFKPVQ
jgi:hypothetical protein